MREKSTLSKKERKHLYYEAYKAAHPQEMGYLL